MTTQAVSERRGLWGRLDDGMNPIVVKELRQAVQSKFVVAVLLIFLLLQLLWVGIRLLVVGFRGELDAIDFQAGRDVFTAQQVILLGTCMIFLPLYTALRLAGERNEANTDLLFITTIKPRAIIRGKLFSAIVLAVLIFSACTPFMALTYYLRGIDWPSILLVVGIDFLVVMASVQMMVFLAVIPCNRVLKSLLGLAGFGVLCIIFGMTLSATIGLIEVGATIFYRERGFWAGMLCFVVGALGVWGLFFVWSVALLNAPSANRALPVRLYAVLIWAVSLAVAIYIGTVMSTHWAILTWTIVMSLYACLNLFIATGERRSWSSRVTRKIPRSWLLRVPAFFLYSGAAGGILFATLFQGITLLVPFIYGEYFPTLRSGGFSVMSPEHDIESIVLFCACNFLYAFAYSMTAVFLRTYIFRSLTPGMTPLLMIILLAIGCTLPMLVSFLLFVNTWRYEEQYLWFLGNPFVPMIADFGEYHRRRASHYWDFFTFAAAWAGLALAANAPWILRQFMRFRRPDDAPILVLAEATPEDAIGEAVPIEKATP
jgi:hypothetical protein